MATGHRRNRVRQSITKFVRVVGRQPTKEERVAILATHIMNLRWDAQDAEFSQADWYLALTEAKALSSC